VFTNAASACFSFSALAFFSPTVVFAVTFAVLAASFASFSRGEVADRTCTLEFDAAHRLEVDSERLPETTLLSRTRVIFERERRDIDAAASNSGRVTGGNFVVTFQASSRGRTKMVRLRAASRPSLGRHVQHPAPGYLGPRT